MDKKPQINPYEKLNILLVDDESLMLDMLNGILKEQGVKNVVRCNTGEQAIKFHQSKEFDITFLDIEMKGLNGVETLKQIKKLKPHAFISMLSGSSTIDNVKGSMQAGANSFIAKPYTHNKIIQLLKNYLTHKEKDQQNKK